MPPFKILAVVAAFCVSHGASLTRRQAPAGTVTVDLTSTIGPTKFLGSGFIYGWPDNGTSADNSIPDYFATDIKFNACRAGGAQISAPGWAGGYDGYIKRFESALSNYRTTRKYGGDFILLPHDLWGADSIQGEGTAFPGDNGNWTEAELFLKQVANDLKENDMLEGLVFDIWNEPEIDSFWARSWEQYLEYYVRAHRIIRAELPGTLISGPSAASTPSLDNEKWDSWLSTISTNDTIPDIYAWHQIGDENRELDRVVPDFNTLLAKHSLPERPIDINEYAWSYRQNPANSAFYLAQLERHNLRGLRANWGGGSALHDFMADLVFNNADGSYSPNGDWYLYKYYAQMVGERVATAPSADYQSDVFAVVDGINVKVLAGTPTIQSNYEIKISGLSHLGLPSGGTVEVHSRRFDWLGTKVDVGEPVDLGVVSLDYSSDTLTILVQTPTNSTAFAFEFTGQN
ncbi:glycoside hydrolase superfamily [Colletotrichum cereale]|nr:glycoside hydrolase superfamily [Colletotrichum cereale]